MKRLLHLACFGLLMASGILRGQVTVRLPAPSSSSPQRSAPGSLSHNCYEAKDLVMQALERLRADSPANVVDDANQLLLRAIDLCSESGEAWYYRSLLETRLGHAAKAANALRQANLFPSDALKLGLNPFVLAVPKPPPANRPIQNRWALIIGVGKFVDLDDLPNAESDATEFAKVLTDPRYGNFPAANVKKLLGGQVTRTEIMQNIEWLAKNAQPDDLVVIYVATHGTSNKDDLRGAKYLVASDTNIKDTLYSTGYPMAELSAEVAGRILAQRVAIFLDTCNSGTAAAADKGHPLQGGDGLTSSALSQLSQGGGRMIFAASGPDQPSRDSETLNHGYFTYFLMEGIKAAPQQPLSQLFRFVQQNVAKQVDKDFGEYHPEIHQTPIMTRSAGDTDFPLGNPEAKSVALLEPMP
jgi:Caspase domain